MYKVLIPEGFYPTSDEDDASLEELVNLDKIDEYIFDTGFLDYDEFSKLQNWQNQLKWAIRNKAPFEVDYFDIGVYRLKVVFDA